MVVRNALLALLFVVNFAGFAAAEDVGSVAKASLQSAKGEDLSEAMGHYGRARALLITAIREFDKGAAKASPEALLDVEAWRNSLIGRAKDLERVLDPQPRVSAGGVKYEADSRLLGEARK